MARIALVAMKFGESDSQGGCVWAKNGVKNTRSSGKIHRSCAGTTATREWGVKTPFGIVQPHHARQGESFGTNRPYFFIF